MLLNLPGLEMVNLKDVYKLDFVPQIDGELAKERDTSADSYQASIVKTPTLKPAGDETLLVVRIGFDQNAADDDGKIRVSPMSVRLVGWKDNGGVKSYSNYYPIGTLENAAVLLRNKPDDPLIMASGKSVDFVFKIPRDAVFTDASAKPKEIEIKPGVFIEVKRMAQMDLGGRTIKGPPTYSKDLDQADRAQAAGSDEEYPGARREWRIGGCG